jgi:hypothetical protein
VEPIQYSKATRESWFKLLFGLGTAVYVFDNLLELTKGGDRTPDLIIAGTAAALLAAALFVGRPPKRTNQAVSEWRSGPLSTTILVVELILSLVFVRNLAIYVLHGR